MILHKKEIKQILLTITLILLIVISNFPRINEINPQSDDINNQNPIFNEKSEIPNISGIKDVSDYINGTGVNQTVKIFANNQSRLTNQEKYFEIPPPDSNTNLSHGDFYFEFENNFTTEHIVEDDSALYPSQEYYETYQSESSTSYINVHNGTEYPNNGFDDLINDQHNEFNVSSNNGLVNFTIFTEFDPTGDNPIKAIDFVRENIMGFVLNFPCNVTKDVNLTVYMKDFYYTGDFQNLTTTIELNSSSPETHDFNEILINENLKYINTSGWCLIRFIFERDDNTDFNLTIYDIDATSSEYYFYSFIVMDLPISDQKQIALEFDLRGKNSTIHGCYLWIRTLNLTKAENAKLNISLYYANDTISRNYNNLNWFSTHKKIQPNLTTGLIFSDEWDYNAYNGDELFYFKFDSSFTFNLTRYNYFIVIKSNQSDEGIYNLVCNTRGIYGDVSEINQNIDHLTLLSNNSGVDWNLGISSKSPNLQQLDASQFKLNITRGYIPSDFQIEGVDTLMIQKNAILPYTITYNEAPILTWGLGQWNHDFNPSLEPFISSGNFRVNFTWNNTNIKEFKFDVNYTVEAFRNENITSFYNAKYNKLPEWIFNYTLNLYDSIFDNWNFTQFWYLYPNYYNAYNLAIPNSTQVYNKTGREFSFAERLNYKKFVVNTSIIDPLDKANYTGTYSLNLTSPNAIIDDTFMHSYINFKGMLWETRGFMYGDNISVSLDIQDYTGSAPLNGRANVSLFYPNGTKFPNTDLYSENGKISIDKTILTYRFNNDTILELTKNIPLATDLSDDDHYSLGFFWTNGSIVGCKKVDIYIFVYEINLSRCIFIPEDNINNLQGRVFNNFLLDYSLLIASINETTGYYNPNFYPINKSIKQTDGTFSYNFKGKNLQVYMNNFLQNETILNPKEKMKIKVVIQNLFIFDLDVKIDVKLVSLVNEEWIIAENTSIMKKIGMNGLPNGGDTEEFNVELTIPEFNTTDLTWKGVNAPVRQGGAKTIVDIYIENNYAGTYNCNNYSLLINDTDNKFEGYILALKYSQGLSATTILEKFEREDCVYLPNKTTFMANIYDKYYVSFFNQYIEEFELKLNSKFDNIIINPLKPLFGETFNLSAVLTTEYGSPLQNKEVLCQYYKDGKWTNISEPKSTNVNGSISFEIESLTLEYEESLVMKLSWAGDIYTLNNSQAIPIDIITQLNDILIRSKDDESIVYRHKNEAITFKLENKGNSILRIIDIEIDIEDKDLDYKIRGENDIILNWFTPGETTEIIVEIEISDTDFSTLDIRITVTAVNILSNEILVKSYTITVDAVDKTIADLFIEFFIFIMVGIIILISFIAYFYAKKTIKKTEIISKEPAKRKPRRGRYVKVSELETEELEKKDIKAEKVEGEPRAIITEEKIESKEIEEIKTTDLDTLLEEEIVKKEEPPPKKARKLPKKVKKPSKKPRKVTTKPVPAKKLRKRKKPKKEKKTLKTPKKQPKKKIKPPKKVEPKRVKKKKTTDLDDLLKEKGLDESK
ncbi:MAG: hypothetical protein ACFFDO_02980 [Candidatus Thorarchaeota archaeon]